MTRQVFSTSNPMEAMVAASVAALAVYDMCKGLDKRITIGPTRLLYKSGGKSGVFRCEADGGAAAAPDARSPEEPA